MKEEERRGKHKQETVVTILFYPSTWKDYQGIEKNENYIDCRHNNSSHKPTQKCTRATFLKAYVGTSQVIMLRLSSMSSAGTQPT